MNNIENEIWKPIFTETINKELGILDGVFSVSNLGRIKNNLTEKILKQVMWGDYYVVILSYSHSDQAELVSKTLTVHRLVASAFIPNPNNLPYINHKDEDKLNNNIENLEWCTAQYNRKYGTCSQRMIETKKKKGKIQRICQLTLDGSLVNEFKTAKDASGNTQSDPSSIYQSCRRFYKQSKGYVFLFKKDYDILKNEDGSVNKEFLDDVSAFRVEINKRRKLNDTKQ